MKLVFLDIDGVLNHGVRYERFDFPRLFPEHCARFQQLCLRADAEIIVVSNWKGIIPAELLVEHLRAAGITASVRGATPFRATRGEEVKLWREMNLHQEPYVILDDRTDYMASQPLVRTEDAVGLLDEHVERALQLLEAA